MADFGEIAVRKVIASDTAWAFLAVVLAAVRGLGGGRPLPWTLDKKYVSLSVILKGYYPKKGGETKNRSVYGKREECRPVLGLPPFLG